MPFPHESAGDGAPWSLGGGAGQHPHPARPGGQQGRAVLAAGEPRSGQDDAEADAQTDPGSVAAGRPGGTGAAAEAAAARCGVLWVSSRASDSDSMLPYE